MGSIAVFESIWTNNAVHPHACGEYKNLYFQQGPINGSSPRLWGVCIIERAECERKRFIPTPVGSIVGRPQQGDVSGVHPHACGEYNPCRAHHYITSGSSPRLWGVFGQDESVLIQHRFIPTPVGSIQRRQNTPHIHPVHPHACGEYVPSMFWCRVWSGSSPRLWGVSRDGKRSIGC